MRALFMAVALVATAGCGVPKPVVSTATTYIGTRAQIAQSAVTTCGADGENRQAACDLVKQSLAEITATNSELQAKAK
jgi:hypothetical protein